MAHIAITIEQLETLASQVENDNAAEHGRLMRLCRAMVRILAARQPEVFEPHATSITDVAGHYDNSYPPKAERHYGPGAPRLIEIRDNVTDDVATSRGFYHNWRRQTDDRGCFVALDGEWYGCDETGTGRLGQFAAHPGDCARDISLDWIEIEPSLDDLRAAEPLLRGKLAAFLGEAA